MREFVIPLATGITFFLFGMQLVRIGLIKFSGNYLQGFLHRFTKTPYHGFFTGTIATIFLQSSSAVTVITIGLINARMITFYQSLGIILGTNVGTVATAELVALDIGKGAVPLLIIGAVMVLFPYQQIRAIGLFLGGFAIIFLGLDALQMIANPLQQSFVFKKIITIPDKQILIGIIFGLIITSIIQSSSAVTVMTMGMMYYQGLALPFGIAIILGSNIGTCFTAVLAAIGSSKEGKQVATAHILLNLLGVIIFYPFIEQFSDFVQTLTTYPPKQIAHAQLIFNLVSSLAILLFIKPFAKLTLFLSPSGK